MKQIKLKIVNQNVDEVTFQIAKQTHRGNKFGPDNKDMWTASNGFTLVSYSYPSYNYDFSRLYLKGCTRRMDDLEITVPRKVFNKITEAVEEYNKFFADKKVAKPVTIKSLNKEPVYEYKDFGWKKDVKPENTIDIAELAMVFASEFVSMHKKELQSPWLGTGKWSIPFLKMNGKRRMKLVQQTIDKLWKDKK